MKPVLAQLARFHALSYHWIESRHQGGPGRWAKDFWPLARDKWQHTERYDGHYHSEKHKCNVK